MDNGKPPDEKLACEAAKRAVVEKHYVARVLRPRVAGGLCCGDHNADRGRKKTQLEERNDPHSTTGYPPTSRVGRPAAPAIAASQSGATAISTDMALDPNETQYGCSRTP
jgi:hypothetical protein